jgi:hypothetical protein
MLVPLRLRYGVYDVARVPESRYAAFDIYNVLDGSLSETIPVPGATTSGLDW